MMRLFGWGKLKSGGVPTALWVQLCGLLLSLSALSACTLEGRQPLNSGVIPITLVVDGEVLAADSAATNVRELLTEQNINLGGLDEVDPPLFTPLTPEMTVQVWRVAESIELLQRSIPFERKIVRNESMDADQPPQIIQAGQNGLVEVTVRIVYRDGIEVERRETQSRVIEEAQDEVVMVGLGVALPDSINFGGSIAYISGGTAVLLRESSNLPEQLDTGGSLDRRVFSLSPDGEYLLFTRAGSEREPAEDEETLGSIPPFNSLWVVRTQRGARPRPLGVDNVLWADWDPSQLAPLRIAYTTALATSIAPGWEANNDLWIGAFSRGVGAAFEPELLVESYPATYGWWGGNYAWAPTGDAIAYSFADEVGVIPVRAGGEILEQRLPLSRFSEFDTRADWVWVPSLTWSSNGRYLAYSQHAVNTRGESAFHVQALDTLTGVEGRFVQQAGIWGSPHWSTAATSGEIAYLQATETFDSLRSSYTLWMMDGDGSNARQIFPPPGENSYFPRDAAFLDWNGTGSGLVFVFDNNLYLFDTNQESAFRLTQADSPPSNPTWAPYGAGLEVTDLQQEIFEESNTEEPRTESLPSP